MTSAETVGHVGGCGGGVEKGGLGGAFGVEEGSSHLLVRKQSDEIVDRIPGLGSGI